MENNQSPDSLMEKITATATEETGKATNTKEILKLPDFYGNFHTTTGGFYITNKRWLRTIFDEETKFDKDEYLPPPDSPQNSSLIESSELKSISPRYAPTPPSAFQKGHRKVRSESSGITLMSSSPIIAMKQSHRPRSTSIEENEMFIHAIPNYNFFVDNRKEPSETAKEKARDCKQFIEEYYWEMFNYLIGRKKREKKKQESLESQVSENKGSPNERSLETSQSKFEKEILLKQHRKRETIILRSRRLCRISDFKVLKKIGKGAYGEVYLARKSPGNELLALKKLSKTYLNMKNQIAHVKIEQDVLSSDTSLWLVHLLYAFQDSEFIYFAMDFMQGGDFRGYLSHVGGTLFIFFCAKEMNKELSEKDARFYVAEMFLAVDSLHRLGYIHRDLKPDKYGHIKLADFGLSKKGLDESYKEPFKGQLPTVRFLSRDLVDRKMIFKEQQKKVFSLVGSPDYMAVEIFRGKGYDFKCDWWSLGVILFEMIVGIPPFNDDTAAKVFANVMNFHDTLADIKEELQSQEQEILSNQAWDIILKLICEPEERLQTIEEIMQNSFFDGFDWKTLISDPTSLSPPFVPKLSGEEDTCYFEGAESVPSSNIMQIASPRSITPTNSFSSSATSNKISRQDSFLQKLHNLELNLPFDEVSFSKAVIEKDKSHSSDDSGDELEEASSVGVRLTSPRLITQRAIQKMHNKILQKNTNSVRKVQSSERLYGSFGNNYSTRLTRSKSGQKKTMKPEPPSLNYLLSVRDWRILCSGAFRLTLPKDHVILHEGEKNTHLYRIKSGSVRVEISRPTLESSDASENIRKTVTLGKLDRNKVFGELALIEDTYGSVETVTYVVDSVQAELYKIPIDFIFSIFNSDKGLFERFYRVLGIMLADRFLYQMRKEMRTAQVHKTQDPILEDPRNSESVPVDSQNSVRKDKKFIRRFKLPQNEILVQEFTCKLISSDIANNIPGTLSVGTYHICFYGRLFGLRNKSAIPISDISKVKKIQNDSIQIFVNDRNQYLFTAFDLNTRDEAFLIIQRMYEVNLQKSGKLQEQLSPNTISVKHERHDDSILSDLDAPTPQAELSDSQQHFKVVELKPENTQFESPIRNINTRERSSSNDTSIESGSLRVSMNNEILDLESIASFDDHSNSLQLTEHDWHILLRDADCVKFSPGEIILQEGEFSNCIYQIGSGICAVRKAIEQEDTVIGTMASPEMFGEISFLVRCGATAKIVADSHCDIYEIKKEIVDNLLREYPGLGGKFYRFLALVLVRRMKQRETELQLSAKSTKRVFLTNFA